MPRQKAARPIKPFADLTFPPSAEGELARKTDTFVRGALATARKGGDVEAYIRGWVEAEMGRPLDDVP